jgi:hypothetical protein
MNVRNAICSGGTPKSGDGVTSGLFDVSFSVRFAVCNRSIQLKTKNASVYTIGALTFCWFFDSMAQNIPPDAAIPTNGAAIAPAENVYAVGSCHFQIAAMFGGSFDVPHPDRLPPRGTYLLPLTGPMAALNDGFGLFCVDATEERLTVALNAKYANGRWLKYGPVNGPEFVPFDQTAHFQTIQLKGENWVGRAYTADDTTGDEEIRARFFHFCLIHNAHALCGYTPVAWLARPKRNQLWKIKAILESIEFVYTPLAPESSSAASTTIPNQ